ncbi:MAG: YkgJ family cysteine cluster protein [Acidobacteria bacterium]|nr:YkgJ family cysteine cluster protein [Acidobacteriota bacterium]
MSTIGDQYRELNSAVDEEFRRNRRLHGGKIHCARGCTACCHQVFSITEVEAASISRLAKTLSPQMRQTLQANASAYRPLREELLKQHGYIRAWGHLPKPDMRLACPALIDGACAIYDERPVTCRKVGIPLYHPEQPDRIFACELNFSPGESYEDPKLVTIQSGIAEQWTRLQSEFDAQGGRRADEPLSVADALLDDEPRTSPG